MSPDNLAPDLLSCDRDPIHIPGFIQPDGVLLAVGPGSGLVVQTAGETLGMLVSTSAASASGSTSCSARPWRAASARRRARRFPEPRYLGSWPAPAESGRMLDLIAHRRDGVLMLELEHVAAQPATAAETLSAMRRICARPDAANDLQELLQVASAEFRTRTGFQALYHPESVSRSPQGAAAMRSFGEAGTADPP